MYKRKKAHNYTLLFYIIGALMSREKPKKMGQGAIKTPFPQPEAVPKR